MTIKQKFNKTLITSAAIMAVGIAAPITSIYASTANFTSTTKNTSKISVQSLAYDYDDSDDDIEIDFTSKIRLKSTAKATVKDSSGNTYTTTIKDYDNNEIDLDVTNLKAGKTYTVTITGIKKTSASKYGTLTLKFSIPKASSNLIEEVDYDAEDDEVTFDFRNNVSYSNAKVVITNSSGTKTYTTTILEKDNDELSIRVTGLIEGSSYRYTITGVTSASTGSSKTLTGSFTAVDND